MVRQTFPNQLKARFHKRKMERDFLMIGFKELRDAYKELTHSELGLYLYMAENQDGYECAWSPKDFMNKYGVSESSYRRAKQGLIQKGYIIQRDNEIDFFVSKEDAFIPIEELQKEFLNIIEKIKIFGKEEDAERAWNLAEKYKLKELDKNSNEYRVRLTEVIYKEKGLLAGLSSSVVAQELL